MPETLPLAHVTWWELPVADLAAAKDFYGAVFGWTFTPFGDDYAGANAGDTMVGGLTELPGPFPHGIRIYVNVADMEDTLERVAAAGGTVRTTRTEVGGDMGWWAELTAPDGLVVGLTTYNPPG